MAGKNQQKLRFFNRMLYLGGTVLVIAGLILTLSTQKIIAAGPPTLTVGAVHCVTDPLENVKVNFIFSNVPVGQTPGLVNYVIGGTAGTAALTLVNDEWTWKASTYVQDGSIRIDSAYVMLNGNRVDLTYDGGKDGTYDCSDKCPNLIGVQLAVPSNMILVEGMCVIPTATTPAVTETTPVVTETTPVVTETTPVVTETTPVVTETTPVVTETTPAVTETTPVVTETTPVVTETTPAVTETTPAVTEDPTDDPTEDPTEDPTDDPTEDPTEDPTDASTGGNVEPLSAPAVSDAAVLIPVTGAPLTETAGTRTLYGGFSVLGAALVLSGIRKKRS